MKNRGVGGESLLFSENFCAYLHSCGFFLVYFLRVVFLFFRVLGSLVELYWWVGNDEVNNVWGFGGGEGKRGNKRVIKSWKGGCQAHVLQNDWNQRSSISRRWVADG